MGRLEAGMVRSLKTGAVCAAQARGLIPMKKCAPVQTLFSLNGLWARLSENGKSSL